MSFTVLKDDSFFHKTKSVR